jgi:hypothetical protein
MFTAGDIAAVDAPPSASAPSLAALLTLAPGWPALFRAAGRWLPPRRYTPFHAADYAASFVASPRHVKMEMFAVAQQVAGITYRKMLMFIGCCQRFR